MPDSAIRGAISRRDFLRYAGFVGATIGIGGGMGGLLAGCDDSSTTTTGATTVATASTGTASTGTESIDKPKSSTTETQPTTKPSGKVAYLTFDDGPSGVTPQLLRILDANHVRATFFVVGIHAKEFPGSLKQIVDYGNVVAVHSWTHDYAYIYKNTDNFLTDFNKLKDYIHKETGIAPNVCRFPGGTNNTVCFHYNKDHIMKKIVALVNDMGFKYYDWNVSSAEASSPPPSKDVIVKTVVAQCKKKKTAVILFHDIDNQGYLDAVPEVIANLRSMGFTFETLSPDRPPKSESALVQFRPS